MAVKLSSRTQLPREENECSTNPRLMSNNQSLCRELRPYSRQAVELIHGGFSYEMSRRLPHLLREKRVDLGQTDKVFASQWLTEDEVIVGTKCNKLFVVDVTTDHADKMEIPTLKTNGAASCENSCGIHCISINEERQYLASGADNPNELALYKLPEIEPLAIGLTHTDWIFDMQWITDTLLITGSRDSTMALWSMSPVVDPSESCMAEDVPKMEAIFKFANVPADTMEDYQLAGERVRSLAYNKHKYILGSLQTNPGGATAYFWDAYIFQQMSRLDLPYCAENVCMELDQDGSHLCAAGSRSHVTFIDDRLANRPAGTVRSPDKDSGVRSLQFNKDLLSIGTGAGHLYFYDIRARKFLHHDNGGLGLGQQQWNTRRTERCFLKASPGWLRHDQTYRDFFSGLPEPPNAIYSHCYSPMKTKIFTAGGPLPLGLYGNYTAVWL